MWARQALFGPLAVLGVLASAACIEPSAAESTTAPFTTAASGETHDASGPTTASSEATSPGDTTEGDTSQGDTSESEGTTGEPVCPPPPDPLPSWVTPLHADVIARLSGAAEVSPGVTLDDRASASNRAAARSFLQAQWEAHGLAPQLHGYAGDGTNLYAWLPATIDTTQTVVIGAHFDSVPNSPGANDDATGVAMVTSLGRWLHDLPCRELHVILVLFDQEELGLLGSQAFASFLVEQGVDVHSVHTIDQMGWDGDGDRALELERADPGLYELYEAAEPLAPGVTPLVATNTGFTDHVSFRELGFPAIGLTEEYVSGDTTPHYHLPSDTFATVNLEFLASSTALLHVTLGQLVAPAR